MNSNTRFQFILRGAFIFAAIVFYLYALDLVGRITLQYPNFIEVKDAGGSIVQQPSDQPVIPDIITVALTGLTPLMALNLGRVLGIELRSANATVPTTNTIMKELTGISAKYWIALAYIIGLVWCAIFFVRDGGFQPNHGTIVSVINDYTVNLIAITIAVFASVIG